MTGKYAIQSIGNDLRIAGRWKQSGQFVLASEYLRRLLWFSPLWDHSGNLGFM
jgi:hypothetical protein